MLFLVFGGIDAAARSTTGSHCLIPIFPGEESILFFAIMHAFDYFWSNQGAFGDNSLQGNHMIEVG
jgi:hypothetical protein